MRDSNKFQNPFVRSGNALNIMIMKNTVLSLLVAGLTFVSTAPEADARTRFTTQIYISGYSHGRVPIYRERYCVGHDYHGRPILRTRPHRRHHHHAPVRYVAPRPYYPSGFTFHGSFGR